MWKQSADRWGGFRFFLNSLVIRVALLFGMNKDKALKFWISNRERIELDLSNREGGLDMHRASDWLDYAAMGYCFFIGLPIGRILMKIFDSDHLAFDLIPLLILYISYIVYISFITYKNRHLIYFRLFDYKDIKWHEKWRYATYVYTLGGLLGLIGGIFISVLITT